MLLLNFAFITHFSLKIILHVKSPYSKGIRILKVSHSDAEKKTLIIFMMEFDNLTEGIMQHSANDSQRLSVKSFFSQLNMNKMFWTKISLILVSKLIQIQIQVFHQRYDKATCLSSVHYKVTVHCLVLAGRRQKYNITNFGSAESWKLQ